MRFCFVLPHFDEQRNSFSKLLAPLALELQSAGHAVTILSGNADYEGPFAASHRALPARIKGPAFLSFLSFILQTTFWIWRRRQQFDIVHNLGVGSTLYQNVITAHACHRAWIRVKWDLGQYISLFLNPLHVLVWALESFNYRRRIPVIAVCQRLADEIIKYYPCTQNRISIIPNGVESPPPLRKLPRGPEFLISFASNDHRKKGLGELIESMALARKDSRNWQLWVLGHDPKQAVMESHAARLGVRDRVHFKGHVTNVHDYFATSDVFCLPSYYEAFGLVYIEAAQAGTPVLGTEVGIYPDLIKEFESIRPITLPMKTLELYQSLKQLEDQPDLRLKLAEQVKEKAQCFTIQSMVAEQLAFYRALPFSRMDNI